MALQGSSQDNPECEAFYIYNKSSKNWCHQKIKHKENYSRIKETGED
jgi:hypothetical protein